MATPQAEAQLAALTAAYQIQTLNLRNRLEQFVRGTWRGLQVYRAPQRAVFVREVTPVVSGAQRQMSSLTSAFMAHQREFSLGEPFRPVPVDPAKVTGSVPRNGIPPSEVYGRPFNLVWRDLHDLPHESGNIEKAIQSGEDRAVQAALTDVQLAKTHTVKATVDQTPVTSRPHWFKRILEGPESCALCVVASTQRYQADKLLPIHPGCDCSVEPQWGPFPKDLTIEPDVLQNAHDAIQQTFGISDSGARRPDYRKLILVESHGELGPVLTVKAHMFTRREAKRSGLRLTDVPHA